MTNPHRTLLIAEKFDEIDYFTINTLRAAGYDCIFCRDGEELLVTAFQRHPDALLIDYDLPKVPGLIAAHVIKSAPSFQGVPVLFMLDKSSTLPSQDYETIESFGYLLKPCTSADIVAALHERLGPAPHFGRLAS